MKLEKIRIEGYIFDNGATFPVMYTESSSEEKSFFLKEIDISDVELFRIEDEETPYHIFYEENALVIKGDNVNVFTLECNCEDNDFINCLEIALKTLEILNKKWRKKHPEPNV